MNERKFIQLSQLALLLVMGAGVILRLLGITRPLLGNFSQYQAGQAMMAQFFIESHFTELLFPKVNLLMMGSPGLVLLYYPVSSLLVSVIVSVVGGSIDFWGRFQAVIFFVGACIYLYRFVQRLSGATIALGSVVAFSLSPLTIIYGQSFQNEMLTVFFSLLFLDSWHQFIKSKNKWHFFLSAVAMNFVLLTRPNCLYLFLPAYWMSLDLSLRRVFDLRIIVQFIILILSSSILPALWYSYIWNLSNYEVHIYSTIFSQMVERSSFLSPLIFSSAYYLDLFKTLSTTVLTPIGFIMGGFGLYLAFRNLKSNAVFLLWFVSFTAVALTMPRKLIDQNFYFLHFVPIASYFISVAFWRMLDLLRVRIVLSRAFPILVLTLMIIFSLRYSIYPAFKTMKNEENVIEAAEITRSLTNKKHDRIIFQGIQTQALAYYSDRLGWELNLGSSKGKVSEYQMFNVIRKLPQAEAQERIEAFKSPKARVEYLIRREGATHLVISDLKKYFNNPEFRSYIERTYPLVYEKKDVCLIFKLTSSG